MKSTGYDRRFPQNTITIRTSIFWQWSSNRSSAPAKGRFNGYIVSGKDEYDSASIFLPFSSYGNGTSLNDADLYGFYWSSVLYSDNDYGAWFLYFHSSYHITNYSYYRYYGQSVRPVQGFTE